MSLGAGAPVLDASLRQRLDVIADSFQRLTGQAFLDDPSAESFGNASRVMRRV